MTAFIDYIKKNTRIYLRYVYIVINVTRAITVHIKPITLSKKLNSGMTVLYIHLVHTSLIFSFLLYDLLLIMSPINADR